MRLILHIVIYFLGLSVYAQKPVVSFAKTYPPILELTQEKIINNLKLKNSVSGSNYNVKVKSPSMAHTAFFCKLEDRLGKSSKFPVKMRLGDINYTNTLEGKNMYDPVNRRALLEN